MKKLLFALLLVPGIAQAQFQLTATDIANSNIRIPIRLVDVTDGETPETGLTPTCTRSINGAAKASCTGTITEIGTGDYYLTPDSTELVPGMHVVTVTDADAKTFTATYRVSSGISNRDFPDPQLTAESGTTLTLAASAVAADDQFNTGFRIAVFDYTTKAIKASSCIVDSTNTGETIVTADDISGLIVGSGGSADYYSLVGDAGCAQVAEVTAQPSTGTASVQAMLRAIYQLLVNKFDSTASEQRWYRADGSTVWTTKDIADDDTTYTRTAAEADD